MILKETLGRLLEAQLHQQVLKTQLAGGLHLDLLLKQHLTNHYQVKEVCLQQTEQLIGTALELY